MLRNHSCLLVQSFPNSDTDQPATGVFVGDYQDVRGGPWLWPNTWVHLAGTYDGTTQRLYVNGTEVANRAQSGPIEVSGGVLRIGGDSIWGELFKGRIDEIRVYNRALSATEITTDMNTSVATSSPPVFLVGDKNVAPVTDSISQGKAQAFQTQAAVTGWVTGLSVYVDTHAYPVDATYSSLAQSVASFIPKVAGYPIRTKLAVAVCRRFRGRCWNSSDSFPTRGPALPILKRSDGRAVLSAITATGAANPGVQKGRRRCFDVRHAVVTPRSQPGRSCTGRRRHCRCGSGVPTW